MTRIYIPIFADHLGSKTFSLNQGNPGVGGTQFTSIRLALLLANACPDWKIILVNVDNISLEDQYPNIIQKMSDSPEAFFQELRTYRDDIIIATVSILKKVNTRKLKKLEDNIVCWSRHPFDKSVKELNSKIKFKGVVCVGTYQFYSNTNIAKEVFYIQNPFIFPKVAKTNKFITFENKEINIVYVGALVPAKGFLEVAKSWQSLKLISPDVKLHVVGSTNTYGKEPESNLIPTTSDFAKKILRFIPEEDIKKGKVIFYGNLGEDKFQVIQTCDMAILNPTGVTEAFPASPLECMACGVPVIASNNYGMSDCMRFFPELVVHSHKDIAKRVKWLISDPLRYKELQQRSIAVAKWFDSQTDQIVTRWIRLISSITSNSQENIDLLPIMPFHGSRTRIIYLKYLSPIVRVLKGKA